MPERLIPVRCWHLSLLLVSNGGTMTLLVEEIRQLETRLAQLEQMLAEVARQSPGLYLAAVRSRHFASWFGLTPKEHSSARQGESSCNCCSTRRQ
jgi:transposase